MGEEKDEQVDASAEEPYTAEELADVYISAHNAAHEQHYAANPDEPREPLYTFDGMTGIQRDAHVQAAQAVLDAVSGEDAAVPSSEIIAVLQNVLNASGKEEKKAAEDEAKEFLREKLGIN